MLLFVLCQARAALDVGQPPRLASTWTFGVILLH